MRPRESRPDATAHPTKKTRKHEKAETPLSPDFMHRWRVAGATSTGTRDLVTVRHRRADMRYAHRVH